MTPLRLLMTDAHCDDARALVDACCCHTPTARICYHITFAHAAAMIALFIVRPLLSFSSIIKYPPSFLCQYVFPRAQGQVRSTYRYYSLIDLIFINCPSNHSIAPSEIPGWYLMSDVIIGEPNGRTECMPEANIIGRQSLPPEDTSIVRSRRRIV